MYGVRDSEADARLRLTVKESEPDRRPVAESWFVTTEAALAKVDPKHSGTQAAAVVNRVFRAPPVVDSALQARYLRHSDAWIEKHLRPISYSELPTVEEWLAGTHYTMREKENMRKVYEEMEMESFTKRLWKRKAFVKDEFYAKVAHARLICASEDLFKMVFGRFWKAVENQVFALPHFAKHIPRSELANALADLALKEMPILVEGDDAIYFDGERYRASDYESYESLLIAKITSRIERAALRRICGQVMDPALLRLADRFYGWDGSLTTVHTRHVKAVAPARRFSGDHQTSVGNGLANFLCWDFIREEKLPINEETFEAIGLRAKLSTHDDSADASFCGIILDPVERQLVRDPVPVLMKFGWSKKHQIGFSDRKVRAMLRVKALSLMYEHPACPVISAFADYVLRFTRDDTKVPWQHLSYWEREILSKALEHPVKRGVPGPATRALVHRHFGIAPEVQMEVEEYFDTRTELGPFSLVALGLPVPAWTLEMADQYVSDFQRRDDWFDHGMHLEGVKKALR
jgi:hypothetical protein